MRDAAKPLVWLEGEVKTPPFSVAARVEAGFLLRRLQRGDALHLPHSRPMPSVEVVRRPVTRIEGFVMQKDKQRRLSAAGWRVGSARELLDLSDDEVALIEMKLALARGLRQRRRHRGWTQLRLAQAIGSSQSRVAKMETGDPSVSLDLLMRALLALGASTRDISRVLDPGSRSAA